MCFLMMIVRCGIELIILWIVGVFFSLCVWFILFRFRFFSVVCWLVGWWIGELICFIMMVFVMMIVFYVLMVLIVGLLFEGRILVIFLL